MVFSWDFLITEKISALILEFSKFHVDSSMQWGYTLSEDTPFTNL